MEGLDAEAAWRKTASPWWRRASLRPDRLDRKSNTSFNVSFAGAGVKGLQPRGLGGRVHDAQPGQPGSASRRAPLRFGGGWWSLRRPPGGAVGTAWLKHAALRPRAGAGRPDAEAELLTWGRRQPEDRPCGCSLGIDYAAAPSRRAGPGSAAASSRVLSPKRRRRGATRRGGARPPAPG